MRKDLLIKSTLGIAVFSMAVYGQFTPLDVKGYDSRNLVCDKAIAGMDISVDNLISVGGSDLYVYEMDSIISGSIGDADKSEDKEESSDSSDKTDKVDTDDSEDKADKKDNDGSEDKADKKDKDDSEDKADKKDNDGSEDKADEDNKDDSKDKADEKNKDDSEDKTDKKESEYENVGISIANDYVNVRAKSNTDSEIVGKLYRGCAATIIKTDIKKSDGLWTKIESGNVKGYIKKEYLAIGFDAEELVGKFGTKYAVVNTTTLNVRTEMNTDCKIVTQIPVGESYQVINEYDEWVEIAIDDDLTGYVAKEYVDIEVEFEKAISVEEEQEQIRREQEALEAQREQERKLKEQQEAQRKAEEEKKAQADAKAAQTATPTQKPAATQTPQTPAATQTPTPTQTPTKTPVQTKEPEKTETSSEPAASPSGSTGADVASYALKFVGNRYVYGGTSLTNGTDCSGFTMSVYKAFGYSLPHHSGSQALCGKSVTVSTATLQPGDLLFYTNSSGVINHVTMYIGNGRVVHASNERDGIKTSIYNYRTPCCARRIIN